MELGELERRLAPFARAKYGDPDAAVSDVHRMPGHAGFSYGFSVRSHGRVDAWVLRLPPPGARWTGTADVLRQVAVLNALDGTAVPHCSVRWFGDELEWFGRPYFVVPKLAGGGVLRLGPGEWGSGLSEARLRDMARQAMTALARLHRLDWERATPGLGPPIACHDDVTRWDRFVSKAAEPARVRRAPEIRKRLLASPPSGVPVGIFHGDFQVTNLFYSYEGKLLAVIDWELAGVGATLNDLGWIATMTDREAWADGAPPGGLGAAPFPGPEELIAMYVDVWGEAIPPLAWFRALAAYKFAIISGLNLALHRRGKRPDPIWETFARSIEPLLDRAANLIG